MWSRSAAAGLLLGLAALASGQPGPGRAAPPDPAALARLNLKTEWSVYLPLGGGRDTVELVQTIGDQVFVQTRTGTLTAVDALTGKVQWQVAPGNGAYTNVYPVAANDQFVFAATVTRLHAFYRKTGVVEFSMDMETTPVAGLACDAGGIYAALATQPHGGGAHRVVAYDLPSPIVIPELGQSPADADPTKSEKKQNPIDALTGRYPAPGPARSLTPPGTAAGPDRSGGNPSTAPLPVTGAGGGSRTPSLASVPRVVPPYKMEAGDYSPSLVMLPSLRQPYSRRDDAGKYVQRTPSLATIPPSVGAALALSDMRPKEVAAKKRWEYPLGQQVIAAPIITPSRAWVATGSKLMIGLSKADRSIESEAPLWEQVAAAPGQGGTLAYIPLHDGTLIAADLQSGNRISGLAVQWRVNVGGVLNQPPVVTTDAVLAAGDHSGVTRIDRATGAVVWRTDRLADRVAAANTDFVYVRDRQGRLLVFDAKGTGGLAAPLAAMDVAAFNVPVVNTATDRVFLAADNGLLVCARDAARKYEQPVRMAPPILVNAVPRVAPVAPKMPTEEMPDAKMPDPKMPDPKMPNPKAATPKKN